jgi:hypothetical protein
MGTNEVDPLCPPNFWKDEPSHSERVLLVVHVDVFHDVKRIAEQIAWIGKNVFPFSVFRKRRLVLMSYQVQKVIHALDEPWDWEPFEDWQDLYRKLLVGGFFVKLLPSEHYFHAALFINVREDGTAGCGYALPEVKSERCILRAMFLASRGNLLFGDWGWAVGYSPRVTHDELIRTTILPTYIYENVSFQWYPGNVRAGRALLLFLPHYLRPQFATKDALTLRTMENVREMVNCTLFDAYARRRARWNAYWWLYFAEDGNLLEHQWVIGQELHWSLIENYVAFRLWMGSSFYKAIFRDVVLFLLLGPCLFALVEFLMLNEPIPTSLVHALIWFCGWQLVYYPLQPFTKLKSVKELMKWVLHRTMIFLVLDPLFKVWRDRFDLSIAIVALAFCCIVALLDNLSGIIILDDPFRRDMVSVLWTGSFAAYGALDPRLDKALYFLAELLLVWFPFLTIVHYRIGNHQRFSLDSPDTIRSWVLVPACVVVSGIILKNWIL